MGSACDVNVTTTTAAVKVRGEGRRTILPCLFDMIAVSCYSVASLFEQKIGLVQQSSDSFVDVCGLCSLWGSFKVQQMRVDEATNFVWTRLREGCQKLELGPTSIPDLR